jgi:hypothetical protein
MGYPLAIRDLVSLGFPTGVSNGYLLMLKMYLDDTGTHDKSPVVGVGGLIGTQAQWTAFDTAWRALRDNPMDGKPPLSMWHSFDCRWGFDEFAGYNEAERNLITRKFRDIITTSGVVSASNMIDKVAWNELVVSKFPSMASPETTCLFQAITRVLPWAAAQSEGPRIAVYYDIGRNGGEPAKLAALLSDARTHIPQIFSFTFLPVEAATPLQGADMIATEAFWYAKDFMKLGDDAPMRAHFKDYLAKNYERGNGELLGREEILRDIARRNPDGTLKANELWRLEGRLS